MKRILLLCLLTSISYMSISQTLTLIDSETNKPIVTATVKSQNSKIFATTNTEGQVDITVFKGTEKIEFHSLGYKTEIKSYDELKSLSYLLIMIPSHINLDDVVISATRWNQTSDNVPSEIISISQKEIILQNPQTAADLLGISDHVFIQKSQQGGGSPMIRGFATNRLLYSVDGVRMNTAIFRGGNIQNVINLDPFTVENTEVLFGPGSVTYGSDAIGGVMSFRTLTPQLSLDDKPLITGKAVTRYSSANNEKTGHFDVNIGWKKWASVTSFSSWNFDNLRQGSHGPDDYIKDYYVQRQDSTDAVITQNDPLLQIPSAYSQINLMQKVRFKPNENWNFQYGFQYSETSPYGRYDRHNRIKNDLPRYAEWNYGPQKWMMNNFSIENKGSNALYDRMIIHLAYQYFEESRIDRSFNKIDRTTNTEHVRAYSANLDFIKVAGTKHIFFYGAEYVLNNVLSNGVITDISTNTNIVGPSRYPNSLWNSAGLYVNDEYKISRKFSLSTGLRYNQYILDADFTDNLEFYPFPFSNAHIDKGSLTGSIGGVYRPSKTWVINTNFGTAFRAPNVDDIGKVFDSEPGAVTVPNPNLEAEYAYNLDFGMAKIFGNTVKIDFTAYYTILKNAIVRRDFTLNGSDSIMYDGELSHVQALQNAAEARVYGIQGGLEIKLPGGFNFSSDINYQKGEEESDDGTVYPSRHAAPLFGTSSLNYEVKKLDLRFYTIYQGERKFEDMAPDEQGKDEIYAKDANGNNYAPAWYTLNIKAVYTITDNFTLSTGIENLTDQRYRPYSSGISGPGRNFIFSLRYNF